MKQTLTTLLLAVLLTSCGENRSEKEMSSDAKTQENFAAKDSLAPGAGSGNSAGSDINSVLIPVNDANNMIQAYHQSIQLGKNPNQNVSFMLNATILRDALNSAPNITKLDVYLATGSDGKMTLVYVGAYDSSGVTVEQPYTKPDGSQWVMDQVMPCPTCDKIGIHPHPDN